MKNITVQSDPSRLLLSAEELAEKLSISTRTLWRLRSAGKLPLPVKIGGSIRWNAGEIHAWVAAGCPSLHIWNIIREQ